MNKQFRELAKTLVNAVERSAAFDVRFGRYSLSDCEVEVEFTSDIEDEDYEQDISFYDDRIIVYLSDETSLLIQDESVQIRYSSCVLDELVTIDEFDINQIEETENLTTIKLQGGNTIEITVKGETNE